MATLVSFHAHPDDESIQTAGTLAKAAAAGHEVVLLFGTRGELGEPQPGVLDEGEELWQRRVVECHRSAEVLGVSRVEFLPYIDSGMMGEPTNDDPACFWQADVDAAAGQVAELLRELGADVLTVYDDHGGYGHPDHIQVHRVGRRAAELAGVSRVFEATMNRDYLKEMMAQRAEEFEADPGEQEGPPDPDTFGSPQSIITHAIDVSGFVEAKRASMAAHRSQIGPETFFLAMTPEQFAAAFGTEWYIQVGRVRADGAPFATDILGGR